MKNLYLDGQDDEENTKFIQEIIHENEILKLKLS